MVPGRKSLSMKVDVSLRERGRWKRTWIEVVWIEFKDLALDRPEWQNKIHIAYPNIVWVKALMMLLMMT